MIDALSGALIDAAIDAVTSGAPPAVHLQGAGKTFANGQQALQALDLSVAPGEFVTLLGPSGCGKSTLLRLVAGLLPPSAGRVWLDGMPVAQARHLAYVFQEPTLMPWARVQANVRLPLDLAGVARAEADARVEQALGLVGLAACAQQLPRELSGGMQMRVSIARALVTRPRLLLMDEPFGALDEITRNRLDAELQALWLTHQAGSAPLHDQTAPAPLPDQTAPAPLTDQAGRAPLTVMFVTHSIHEAVFLSQRVLVMAARPGRVVDELRIDEPFPRSAAWRVSPAFGALASRLQDSLLQASEGEPA